jgi:hypothetical protein
MPVTEGLLSVWQPHMEVGPASQLERRILATHLQKELRMTGFPGRHRLWAAPRREDVATGHVGCPGRSCWLRAVPRGWVALCCPRPVAAVLERTRSLLQQADHSRLFSPEASVLCLSKHQEAAKQQTRHNIIHFHSQRTANAEQGTKWSRQLLEDRWKSWQEDGKDRQEELFVVN